MLPLPPAKEMLARLGIDTLSPMQQLTAEAASSGRDLILLSPTGSGKTLAYLLPLLGRTAQGGDEAATGESELAASATQAAHSARPALDSAAPGEGVAAGIAPLALVIVPSRELALQTLDTLRLMRTGLRALCLYGGRPTMDEHRQLREVRPHIVLGTPGRLLDHLGKGNLSLGRVGTLVIDEFDKCLETGFAGEMTRLLAAAPASAVRYLLSATDLEAIPRYVRADRARRLDFTPARPTQRLQHFAVPSPEKDKLTTLARLLSHLQGAPAIVFTGFRESTERVGQYLRREGFAASLYHGALEQDQRERALYKFRSGGSNVLVATDLAARGLDIPAVDAVVHYHLPLTEAVYTHRAGRTARWQGEGATYFIVGPEEALPDFLPPARTLSVARTDIRPTAPAFTTLYIGRGKKDKLSRTDILGFLCKAGGLAGSDIGRIDVGAYQSYAAVRYPAVDSLLARLASQKIKGMRTKIERIK